MKVGKTLMTLGLAGLLSFSSFFSAYAKPKKEVKREVPTLAQAADSLNVGAGMVQWTDTNPRYYMIKGTLDSIYLLIGAKSGDIETGNVKIIYRDKDCGLDGNVELLRLKYQESLAELLKEMDINEPFFVIDSTEYNNSKRSVCAQYKAKQEKEGTLAGTTAPAISEEEIGKTVSNPTAQSVTPAEKTEKKIYTFGKDPVGKVSVEEVARSALVPSLKVTPWEDKNGCKYNYDKNELNQIEQQKLDDFLNQISGGNLNITSEKIIPYLQGLCEQAILKVEQKAIEKDIKK